MRSESRRFQRSYYSLTAKGSVSATGKKIISSHAHEFPTAFVRTLTLVEDHRDPPRLHLEPEFARDADRSGFDGPHVCGGGDAREPQIRRGVRDDDAGRGRVGVVRDRGRVGEHRHDQHVLRQSFICPIANKYDSTT